MATDIERLRNILDELQAADTLIQGTFKRLDGASANTCVVVGQAAGYLHSAIRLLDTDLGRLARVAIL